MTPAAIPDGLVLPLNSAEEINELEEGLMDKEFRSKVIQHLSCIGGDSVSSLVRRILRRVISSEVAVKYNFSGAKGKNSFHTLQLRGVLIAAVRRTFSTASEADIDGVTRKFFSNARDRDGGRARRTSSGTHDN
ncbi:uncharacterized protein LOC112576422 [Pomacea canaliculata]|uniref:uncharacterized protein LOC112576422 n=1 Tax=Pomacea canaliculata TaxID=400727 RepID=UPI000D728335|nr:uncharacterized protein LOC112576422 [Pomacea canaliculata]